MKVLFSHSYFLHLDQKQVANAQPYPPLGTIQAAALLREKGFEVSLFDTMFKKSPEELIAILQVFKPDVFVIYDDGFNYLTKMCLSNMRKAAFLMQQYAKAFQATVITTSSDAADHYDKYMDNGADFVIRGEAELTLLELVSALERHDPDFDSIDGLIYRSKDHILKKNKPRSLMRHLDELPLPAWDLIHIRPYKETWLKKHGYFSINIATTRGCPYKCNWCAKPIFGNSYHMRSPENVVKEIIYLKQRFAMDHIWFCDDIFGLKRSWVSEFAHFVQATDVKTAFKIQSRADLLVQEQYVADLAAAGCKEVWLGAESGSQKILDAMDKGITVDQIKTARDQLQDHDIRAAFFIQYGYPGETMEDINQTLQLITQTLPDDIGISVSYPLPGTAFYNKVINNMVTKKNWTDSDDLDLMFTNTFESPFYKQLHQYTHQVYRLQMIKRQTRSRSKTSSNGRLRPLSAPAIRLLKIAKYSLLKYLIKRKLQAYTKEVALKKYNNENPVIELN